MTTFESFREVTGWKRPGHDHGCAPVQVVPGVWTAHYHDIDSIEKLKAATGGAPITLVVNSALIPINVYATVTELEYVPSLFQGEYTDTTFSWYDNVGALISSTMVTNAIA